MIDLIYLRMKKHIENLMADAILSLQKQGTLPQEISLDYRVEHTKDKKHGDFATNAALILAKYAEKPVRELAKDLVTAIPSSHLIKTLEIAGPGFINITLTDMAYHSVIKEILQRKSHFGHSDYGNHCSINLEFVSANPTGPLHVGHGRSAIYGDVCANLLQAIGYKVHREYYVNDAGRQMDILATSIWLRYLGLCGASFIFPSNGYQGNYVIDIAKSIQQEQGETLYRPIDAVYDHIPADESAGGNKEDHIDALIVRCRSLLGTSHYDYIHAKGLTLILDDIRQDLSEFGVMFDEWVHESSLYQEGIVARCLSQLQEKNLTYTNKGHLWFKATEFGDEKDRVLVRENGMPTYFCADIANHIRKLDHQADHMIDIFGSDHHGYVARMKASLAALGITHEKLTVLLLQFVVLYRDTLKQSMSTRSGEFITLRTLRNEVGNDAARFFYIMRKADQHVDFDLELAKRKSNENPLYYLQYAHARICSVMRQAAEKSLTYKQDIGLDNLSLLCESHENECIHLLSRYPDIIQSAALTYEPHLLVNYLRDLANSFHSYYNAHQFLIDHEPKRHARLALINAIRQVMQNGLELLRINAPETM